VGTDRPTYDKPNNEEKWCQENKEACSAYRVVFGFHGIAPARRSSVVIVHPSASVSLLSFVYDAASAY
jgi:hypothetical protein